MAYYPLGASAFGDPSMRPVRQALLDYEGFGSVQQSTALRMPNPAVVPLSQLGAAIPHGLPGPKSVKGIPGLKQPGHV